MNTETESGTQNDLTQHVQDLRENAGNVAQDLKQQAGAKIEDVKQQAKARFETARQQASDKLEQAKVSAKDVADSVRGFVAEHPFAAFGVGILVGLFLAPRKRS